MNKQFIFLLLLSLVINSQCNVRVKIIENPQDRENDFRNAQPLCPGGKLYRALDGTLKCCREDSKHRQCSMIICDYPGEPGYEVPILDNTVRGLQEVCPNGKAYRHKYQMHCCHGQYMHRICTKFDCIENYGTLLDDFSYDDESRQVIIENRSERPGFCYLPPEEGGIRCRAYIERYYFNKDSGRCEKFVYGGCRGTQNNFVTLDECIATCEK